METYNQISLEFYHLVNNITLAQVKLLLVVLYLAIMYKAIKFTLNRIW